MAPVLIILLFLAGICRADTVIPGGLIEDVPGPPPDPTVVTNVVIESGGGIADVTATGIYGRVIGAWTNITALLGGSGTPGTNGTDGANGTNAYIAVSNVVTLAAGSAAWATNTPGDGGTNWVQWGIPAGSNGAPGAAGSNGTNGVDGINGTNADYVVVTGIVVAALDPYTNHQTRADNPHVVTLQQAVDAGTGPVTNAPYLVQTNATDVTLGGFRLQDLGLGPGVFITSPPGLPAEIRDGSGNSVLSWGAGIRILCNTGASAAASFMDVFRVGPPGLAANLPVYLTLTNHEDRFNTLQLPRANITNLTEQTWPWASVTGTPYTIHSRFIATYTNTAYVWTNLTYQSPAMQAFTLNDDSTFSLATTTYSPGAVGMIVLGILYNLGVAQNVGIFNGAAYKNGVFNQLLSYQYTGAGYAQAGGGTYYLNNDSATNVWRVYWRSGLPSGTSTGATITVWGEIHR